MKPSARAAIAAVILLAVSAGTGFGRPAGVVSLCDVVDDWRAYHGRHVRVRAIYRLGAEQISLSDPACNDGEPVAHVVIGEKTKGRVKKLAKIAQRDRRAWVVLEGTFWGPEPVEVDPRLPAPLRERLQGTPRGYGHHGALPTMIEATQVLDVERVSDVK